MYWRVYESFKSILIITGVLLVSLGCQSGKTVDHQPVDTQVPAQTQAATDPDHSQHVNATYMPGPVVLRNKKGQNSPFYDLPAEVIQDLKPSLAFVVGKLDDGPLKLRDLRDQSWISIRGWRQYARQWMNVDKQDRFNVRIDAQTQDKRGRQWTEMLAFYNEDGSPRRYQRYENSRDSLLLKWDKDPEQGVETTQRTLLARTGMEKGKQLLDDIKILVYPLVERQGVEIGGQKVKGPWYEVNREKVKHEGTLKHELIYHGRFRIKTAAGLFDTILIESRFVGHVGPAKVMNQYYSFMNPTYGIIMEIAKEEVSAFLIYNQKSHYFMHLESLKAPMNYLKPWPISGK